MIQGNMKKILVYTIVYQGQKDDDYKQKCKVTIKLVWIVFSAHIRHTLWFVQFVLKFLLFYGYKCEWKV